MRAADVSAPLATRGGLGAAGEALAARPCTITYVGESVAAQKEGYRPRIHQALCRRFGQDHRGITAAVGGVGVVSTLFFVEEFALRHKPDLCFVDSICAELVNERPLEEVGAVVEGIFAKLTAADAQPCLLHLHRCGWNARCEAVTGVWEEVAERYDAPSVDAGAALRELLASEEIREEEVFRDGIHTTDEGSELVANLLERAVVELIESSSGHRSEAATKPPPPRRYEKDYSGARVIPVALEDAQGRGQAGRYRLMLPYVQIGLGEPLRRRLPGELVGLVVLVGTDSGGIRVSANGTVEEAMLWNETCWYTRLSTIVFDRRPPAGSEVSIELTDAPVDYASCRRPIPSPERIRKTLKVVGYMVLDAERSPDAGAA